MTVSLTTLADLAALKVDEIIDVRSPSEFAEDHIPGSVNLPVLDDAQRAEVGTIYVQQSRFEARKIGAALVAGNAARHLQTYLADKPGGYHPLVYCWRGGQRSGSFASILSQIGWRVELLDGGYRSYRRLVVEQLYQAAFPCKVIILDGNTGSAKTDLLTRLPRHGLQVIDLEGLAHHRGSIFGARPEGQPSQKTFESRLSAAILALDPDRPVVLEAESSRIGNRSLPQSLWQAMRAAPRIAVAAPLAERARYLARTYGDVTADQTYLLDLIQRLSPLHSKEVIAGWAALAQDRSFEALAADLMAQHYDPRYSKQREKGTGGTPLDFPVAALDSASLDHAAAALAQAIRAMPGFR